MSHLEAENGQDLVALCGVTRPEAMGSIERKAVVFIFFITTWRIDHFLLHIELDSLRLTRTVVGFSGDYKDLKDVSCVRKITGPVWKQLAVHAQDGATRRDTPHTWYLVAAWICTCVTTVLFEYLDAIYHFGYLVVSFKEGSCRRFLVFLLRHTCLELYKLS